MDKAESDRRGADLLVDGLVEAGVDVVFSLSGNQIMPVYDALLGSGIRIVHTRHEGAAVYMAEAYAQATGRPGIALITAGPGFANGLSAAWSALCSETPLLLFSGDAPVKRDGHGAFQEMNQVGLATPAVKASGRAVSAATLKEDVARALALATSGRPGPVHISLPDDVVRESPASGSAGAHALPSISAAPGAPTDADLAAVVEAISAAQRPIVVAGPAFRRADTKPLIADFMVKTGIPAIALESPRGLRDPRLGAFAEVLGDADLLVAIGKPLDFMVGFAEPGALPPASRIVQVSTDADAMARDAARLSEREILSVTAGPAATLEALTSACPAKDPAWRENVLAAVGYRPASWNSEAAKTRRIHPVTVAAAVQAFMDAHPGVSLVIDGGEFGQWSQACLDADVSIINGSSGAIGGGLPYAIAAKAARPEHASIVMMGDGTAGFYLAEFETALRNNLPIIAIIGNDARWNAEHQIQARDYGPNRTHSCELSPTRFDRVVAAMGGHGEYVTLSDQLLPALERAAASRRAACINIEIEGLAAPVVRRSAG